MKKLSIFLFPLLVSCATQPPIKEMTIRPVQSRPNNSIAMALGDKIRSNIAFEVPRDWKSNKPAEYSVSLFPDGSVREIQLLSESGLPGFDVAVRRSIESIHPYPVAEIGGSPPRFVLTSYPKDIGSRNAKPQASTRDSEANSKDVLVASVPRETEYVTYSRNVLLKIEKLGNLSFHKLNIQRSNWELSVLIPIYQDGSLYLDDGGPRVMHGSGNELLDRQVLDLVKDAAPFEPLPRNLRSPNKEDVLELVLPFTFRAALKR